MSDYTPTTGMVRARYCDSTARAEAEPAGSHSPDVTAEDHVRNHAEFDRWLAARDSQVRAEALREAADAMRLAKEPGHWNLRDPFDAYVAVSPDVWLERRATRIAREGGERSD